MTDHATLVIELARLEARLLGCWFKAPKLRKRWTPNPKHFIAPEHQAIAAHAVAMAETGQIDTHPLPLNELVSRLAKSGELTRLWPMGRPVIDTSIVEMTPDKDLARWRDLRCLVALRKRLEEVVLSSPDNYAETRQEVLEALEDTIPGARTGRVTELGLLQLGWEQTRAASNAAGWFTGFSDLDSATGGLRPGETWVLGAPTNWGKTSFCLAVADHFLLVHGKGVLYVTCEDPPELIGARLLCRRAEVNGKNARLGRLTQDEYDRCTQVLVGASTNNETPVMLDGRGVHIETIVSDIQDIVTKQGPLLVIADYLQKMRTERKTDNRRHEVNHISQTLSQACQRLGCPLLLTSQITGEQEALRESQDTENEASVVLVGRRGEDDSVSILLRKNKAAPDRMFEMPLDWNRTTGCFQTRDAV